MRPACGLLVLVCILLSSYRTNAVYLGCFPFSKLELSRISAKSETVVACETPCEEAKLPFATSISGYCWCTAMVPNHKDRVLEEDCVGPETPTNGLEENDTPADNLPVKLNYVHNVDNQECALAPLPFISELWETTTWRGAGAANFSDATVGFELDAKTQELTLNADYEKGSVKGMSKDKWAFGMYSLITQPYGPGLGAVTAFYTSSDDNRGAGSGANTWDEIDIEFINRMDANTPEVGPNSVWLNVWSGGKNFSTVPFNQEKTKAVLGDPDFASSARMASYSFNWQPDYINWYMEGNHLLTATPADGPEGVFPRNASNVIFSLWIPIGICEYFGGCNATHGPYIAKIADVRRVVCGSTKELESLAYPPKPTKASPPPMPAPPAASPPPPSPPPPSPQASPPPPPPQDTVVVAGPTPSSTGSNSSQQGGGKVWAPAGLQGLANKANGRVIPLGMAVLGSVLVSVLLLMV